MTSYAREKRLKATYRQQHSATLWRRVDRTIEEIRKGERAMAKINAKAYCGAVADVQAEYGLPAGYYVEFDAPHTVRNRLSPKPTIAKYVVCLQYCEQDGIEEAEWFTRHKDMSSWIKAQQIEEIRYPNEQQTEWIYV